MGGAIRPALLFLKGDDMNIVLYKTASRVKAVNKILTDDLSFSNVYLLEETSILQPTISVESNIMLFNYNYAYIPDFNRYYFIDDVTHERNNIYQLSLKVDVLYTYRTGILASQCLINRSASQSNPYLQDPNTAISCKETIETHQFSPLVDENSPTFVLITSGPGEET